MSIPTATFVRRVLQRNQSEQHTSMFKNSRNVEMTTITSLRCRLGTSSLIWISRNPVLSGFLCYLGNLQRDTHR
jgi:hypothetical protein